MARPTPYGTVTVTEVPTPDLAVALRPRNRAVMGAPFV